MEWTERWGNRLPHPFWLFVGLTLVLAVFTSFGAGWSVPHPATGRAEVVRNLLSAEGLSWLLANALGNVASFRPLALVLVMTVGIGLAERSGFLTAAMRLALAHVPRGLVVPAVIFVAILGNVASDVSYLILPPLGALAFGAAGRSPLAGFCAALAGTGAGYTANLVVAGTDVLAAGLSTEAAKLVRPDAIVTPLDNWYFMAASVFMLTALGSLLTSRWLEPRLCRDEATVETMAEVPAPDRRGVKMGLLAAAGFALLVLALAWPAGGWLHGAPGEDFAHRPFMRGIVPLLSLGFAAAGIAHGITNGSIRKAGDVPRLVAEALRDLAGFFVVAVAIAQFLACFEWSNAGVLLAVKGAGAARDIGLTGLPLLVALAVITAVLSLFIASSSSLWALLAPVFVPVAMLLGYHPAVPQLAFRIAESSTNVITPMTPYLVVLLPQLQRLRPGAGLGTLISLMLPYSLSFFVAWLLLLAAWHALGWPLGPGVPVQPLLP